MFTEAHIATQLRLAGAADVLGYHPLPLAPVIDRAALASSALYADDLDVLAQLGHAGELPADGSALL